VVALPNTPPPEPEAEPEPRAPATAQRSVLVVDDDRYTTYILKGMLVSAGYKVYLAHDGDAALGIAREKKPDIVTVDLRMPGVDGLALVEIFKHDPDTRKMPVIVLSLSDDRDRAMSVGADAFLLKPIDADPLLDQIARLLAERGKSRRKIMLVDDDPGIRMICREVLEGQGYLVREAPEADLKQLKILVGHLKEGQFVTKFRKTFTKGEMNDDLLIVQAKLGEAEDKSEYEEILPTSPP
jgi:CheY-like chemotaxis protein